MMNWKLIEECRAVINAIDECEEELSELLDRREEIEVQLRRGTNHD